MTQKQGVAARAGAGKWWASGGQVAGRRKVVGSGQWRGANGAELWRGNLVVSRELQPSQGITRAMRTDWLFEPWPA